MGYVIIDGVRNNRWGYLARTCVARESVAPIVRYPAMLCGASGGPLSQNEVGGVGVGVGAEAEEVVGESPSTLVVVVATMSVGGCLGLFPLLEPALAPALALALAVAVALTPALALALASALTPALALALSLTSALALVLALELALVDLAGPRRWPLSPPGLLLLQGLPFVRVSLQWWSYLTVATRLFSPAPSTWAYLMRDKLRALISRLNGGSGDEPVVSG